MKNFLLKRKDFITTFLGVVGGFAITVVGTLSLYNVEGTDKLKVILIMISGACYSINGWFSGKKVDLNPMRKNSAIKK